ncbi:MAG: hypothetical protein ACE5PT_09670 [Gemmatimonadales bacterium]
MRPALVGALAFVMACERGNPENSPICALQHLAAANAVVNELRAGTKALYGAPEEVTGTVPTRVTGYGTGRSVVERTPDGLILSFEGEGFPQTPGFGLVLVEDSLDTFKGVLIMDIEPPIEYPRLGWVAEGTRSIPLYGLRVTWAGVSSDMCPLFAAIDTATAGD